MSDFYRHARPESAGDFAKAIATQNEAMGLLKDEAAKKDFATRLKLYESNTPFRQGE